MEFLLLSHLICLCLFLPLLSTAQTNNNITIGSSLTAGEDPSSSWVSPSGDFTFGFQEIQSGNFLLAIWFDKIPDKTITWSANRDNLVPKGSKLLLTSDRSLVLNDPSGREVWRAKLSSSSGGLAYGAMLDTGNFVLATQASAVLWQSFDEPTDTVLPTQVLNRGNQLIARYSATNYSSGRFMMQLGTDGNLGLYTTNYPLFSSTNTLYLSSSTQGSGYQVRFNQSGHLYLVGTNGTTLSDLLSDNVSELNFYQRVILEYDGVLRHYVYPKNQSSQSVGWSTKSFIPDNICVKVIQQTGSGVCGYNSYCQLENDQRPYCSCPPGYTFLDPNNQMSGCSQNFPSQNCEDPSEDTNQYDFKVLQNVDWPLSDYEHYENVTKDWCRDICLPDCFCAVSVFREGGDCWKKKLPLSNGKNDTSVGRTTFIKVSTSSDFSKSHHNSSKKVWVVLFGVSASANIILLVLIFLGMFAFISYKKRTQLTPVSKVVSSDCSVRRFSYDELSKATNGFNEEIGRGAFAIVYKGIICGVTGTPTYIAVKKLDGFLQDIDKGFKAEVNAIGHTHHRNLVRLMGFCEEEGQKLLVYEYMSNGALSDILYEAPKPAWEKRLRIAQGIARGLFYLHEDCSSQIIHCDIKPQNILLDDNHNAQISDFGLAKLLGLDQTHTNTMARGTRGYVAPEWFKNMPITAKVDVYSFGILLLEIICCRRNVFVGDCEEEGVIILTDRAFDCYQEGTINALVEDDMEALSDKTRLERMVKITLWCIQDDPNMRPSMRTVVQMLEGLVEVPDPPNPSTSLST